MNQALVVLCSANAGACLVIGMFALVVGAWPLLLIAAVGTALNVAIVQSSLDDIRASRGER